MVKKLVQSITQQRCSMLMEFQTERCRHSQRIRGLPAGTILDQNRRWHTRQRRPDIRISSHPAESLYIPKPQLVEDRRFLHDFMDEFAFVDLVTVSPSLRITHILVWLDRTAGTYGTISRAHLAPESAEHYFRRQANRRHCFPRTTRSQVGRHLSPPRKLGGKVPPWHQEVAAFRCRTVSWISFFSVGTSTSESFLMYKHPFPQSFLPSFAIKSDFSTSSVR
jgi:hypothetical protein